MAFKLSARPSEVLLTAFLVIYMDLGSAVNPRKVLTKQGYVRGIRQTVETYMGKTKTIYKFLGVPYAEKPLGDLRFKPPRPLRNQRTGVYKAETIPSICFQGEYYFKYIRGAWPEFNPEKDMSEDCLYLNIYTPSTKGDERYPVIFYIHGGSYLKGTPTIDIAPGEFLPTRGVVLVTVQYRLGTFGFFSTGDSEAPGNLGLLDQVEALRWVQDNIEGFGGDKDKVTLLGESAGGSSVSLHYFSPLSEGLFHRGIAVSGVDFSPFAMLPKSRVLDASKKLAKKLNCTRVNTKEILQCLQTPPASTIFKVVGNSNDFMQPFVDRHFLPDEPKKLRKEGKFQKLPLISGFVSQEAAFVLVDQKVKEYNTRRFKKYMDKFVHDVYTRSKEAAPVAIDALTFQYTPWGDMNNCSAFREKLVEMLTDYYVIAPTHAVLTLHSDHGAPTYMFEFAHRSQYHPQPKWMGVVHEDTTAYKFGLPLLKTNLTKLRFNDDDRKVSEITVTMFLNFAKFGNQTTTPSEFPVYVTHWNTFTSSNMAYLKIQKKPVMESKYHPLRMAFWNVYFPTLLPRKSTSSSKKFLISNEALRHEKPKWDQNW